MDSIKKSEEFAEKLIKELPGILVKTLDAEFIKKLIQRGYMEGMVDAGLYIESKMK